MIFCKQLKTVKVIFAIDISQLSQKLLPFAYTYINFPDLHLKLDNLA